MKQNYWKSISITFLISIAFALFGCQKGAIDGKSEETSTSNTDAQEHHVAQESLVDNDGKIEMVDQLTATLSGVAIDDLGMPVEGATVSAFGESTTTNIGGSWKLENVPVSQVITQAALEGVSTQQNAAAPQDDGNQNNTVASVPVTVVKDGYSSAVVYVGTTAVVTESNASIDDDGAGNDTSDSQPNTLVLTGLVGTSGDVVLKKNTSSVMGYLRDATNGNAVAGAKLTLVPDRNMVPTVDDAGNVDFNNPVGGNGVINNNLGATAAANHLPGTVVYGYQDLEIETDNNGRFYKTGLTAATDYTIVINEPGLIAVAIPGGVGDNPDNVQDAGMTAVEAQTNLDKANADLTAAQDVRDKAQADLALINAINTRATTAVNAANNNDYTSYPSGRNIYDVVRAKADDLAANATTPAEFGNAVVADNIAEEMDDMLRDNENNDWDDIKNVIDGYVTGKNTEIANAQDELLFLKAKPDDDTTKAADITAKETEITTLNAELANLQVLQTVAQAEYNDKTEYHPATGPTKTTASVAARVYVDGQRDDAILANDANALADADFQDSIVKLMEAEAEKDEATSASVMAILNDKLAEYNTAIETANLDVTAKQKTVADAAAVVAVVVPAVDVPATPGSAGDNNQDGVGPGDGLDGDEVGNGAAGQDPAVVAPVDVASNSQVEWLLPANSILRSSTVTIGNLWVTEVTVADNVNPFVTWVDDAFELSFNKGSDSYVQLDDTVNLTTNPLVLTFSEDMDPSRVNGQFANQAPEYTETSGGAAVPVLVYVRNYVAVDGNTDCVNFHIRDADGKLTLNENFAHPTKCRDLRLLVDEGKTKVDGNKLTVVLQSNPVKTPHIIDVLLKETDFRDMSKNHLSTMPGNRINIVPDLYRAANKKADAPVNAAAVAGTNQIAYTSDDVVDPSNYRNYWEFSFKIYSEPDLSIPQPVRQIPRPVAAQLTCGDATYVADTEDNIIKLKEDADGFINTITDKALEWYRYFKIDGKDVSFNFADNKVIQSLTKLDGEELETKISGFCDYDTTTPAVITQYNADSLALQEGTEDKRLTVLAKAYATKEADMADWAEATVETNVAIVRLTDDVTKDVKYSVKAYYKNSKKEYVLVSPVATSADGNEILPVVTNSEGLENDADGNPYYVSLINVDDSTQGFYFKGSDVGQTIKLVGMPVGTTLMISPVEDEEGNAVGSKDTFLESETARQLVLDDLTPPLVAVQSENLETEKLEQTASGDGVIGVDDVPGEVLIEGLDAAEGKFYPGLRLTASLYDRTTRRAGDAVDNDQSLLSIPGSVNSSDQHYSSADYTRWNQGRFENNIQFAGPVRDVIIEMTEEMEENLRFCQDDANYPDTTTDPAETDKDKDDERCVTIGAFDATLNGGRDGGLIPGDNLGDFDNVNGTVSDQLDALRSYDSNHSYLVATLADWREVAENTLLTFVGLRDKNDNEIVEKDTGVIFLDRTPPLATQFNVGNSNLSQAESIEVIFDQPISDPTSGEITIYGEGSAEYVVEFAKKEDDTISKTIKGVTYTDAFGKKILAEQKIPVIVTVSDSDPSDDVNDSKMLTIMISQAEKDDPHYGVNMGAYFAPVSNDNDPDVSIVYSNISDKTRSENNWLEVTNKANNPDASVAEQNDAFYCNDGDCLPPHLELTNDRAGWGASSAATLNYLQLSPAEVCKGLGVTTESGESGVSGDACTKVDPYVDGNIASNVSLDVKHAVDLGSGHNVNSLIPFFVNTGSVLVDNVWSAGDGFDLTDMIIGNEISTGARDKVIEWGSTEVNTDLTWVNANDADESYEIQMTFREKIECDTPGDHRKAAELAGNEAMKAVKEKDETVIASVQSAINGVLEEASPNKQMMLDALEGIDTDAYNAAQGTSQSICYATMTRVGTSIVDTVVDGVVQTKRVYKSHPIVSADGNVLSISFTRNKGMAAIGSAPYSARFTPNVISLNDTEIQELEDTGLFSDWDLDTLEGNYPVTGTNSKEGATADLENNIDTIIDDITADLTEAQKEEMSDNLNALKAKIIDKATHKGSGFSVEIDGAEYMFDGRVAKYEITDKDIEQLAKDGHIIHITEGDNINKATSDYLMGLNEEELRNLKPGIGNTLTSSQVAYIKKAARKAEFVSSNLNNNMHPYGDTITIYNVQDMSGNEFDRITIELLDTDHGVEIHARKNGSEVSIAL